MLVLFVYLIDVIDGLDILLFITASLTSLGALTSTSFHIIEGDEQAGVWAKPLRKAAYILVALALLIPSKDTALQMGAAYGVTEAFEIASESEDVRRLAGKSLELLEKTMDEALKED